MVSVLWNLWVHPHWVDLWWCPHMYWEHPAGAMQNVTYDCSSTISLWREAPRGLNVAQADARRRKSSTAHMLSPSQLPAELLPWAGAAGDGTAHRPRAPRECCARQHKLSPLKYLTLLKGVWSMWPLPDLQHVFLECLWYLLQKQRHWPVTSPSGAILSIGSFLRLT